MGFDSWYQNCPNFIENPIDHWSNPLTWSQQPNKKFICLICWLLVCLICEIIMTCWSYFCIRSSFYLLFNGRYKDLTVDRVFRENLNLKFRVPNVSGISFFRSISDSISRYRNLYYPNYLNTHSYSASGGGVVQYAAETALEIIDLRDPCRALWKPLQCNQRRCFFRTWCWYPKWSNVCAEKVATLLMPGSNGELAVEAVCLPWNFFFFYFSRKKQV